MKNWKLWAAIGIFFSSYLPLSLILMIQDIDSNYLKNINYSAICDLPKMLYSNFGPTSLMMLEKFVHVFKNPTIGLSIVGVSIISLVFLKLIMGSLSGGQLITVKQSVRNPSDLMNYTVPYMVAFIGVDLGDGPKVAGFLVFMIFMFVLTYKTKQLFMNPILAVLGYNLYDIEYDVNTKIRHGRMLSKFEIEPEKQYQMEIVSSLLIATKEK
ncbi:hypothetical protein ACS18Q_09735 [Vibrio sp. Vf1514]|uniref:hypothetical protein n=1 Tax=Vibrio sp. Vf1514 TaxID=3437381 RepID=UPI003F8B3A74